MVNALSVAAVAASLLAIPTVNAAGGMYTKSSPVLQIDGKSYRNLVENSNHTTILEFYAPWCGHCQNLKPAYEKAAKSLSGLAKVAAVDCDEESNKPLCGRFGVQGFPTLKIIKPGKTAGKPIVEDYQGPRTAKDIVEAVKSRIPMHVKRITDKNVDSWLETDNSTAKAVLFTDKGTVSPLLKALAVDFLGSISVAQIRDKEVNAVSTFGITSFPTLVLLPGGTADSIVHAGEMTKEAMTAFLSQIAPPNPDPAPKAAKAPKSSKSRDSKKAKSASSAFSKASASHESADSASAKATQTGETLEDDGLPTESPNPNVVTDDTQLPVQLPEAAPPVPTLSTVEALQQACLTKKSGTCILALHKSEVPEPASDAESATLALGELHHKHVSSGHKLFPFYSVPASASEELVKALALPADQALSLVAVNAKRSWVKKFPGTSMDATALQDWVDAIRMGDGAKESLPDSLIVDAAAAPPPPPPPPPPPQAHKAEEEEGKPEAKEMTDAEYEDLVNRAKKPDFDVKEITPEMKRQLMKRAMEAAKNGGKFPPDAAHDEL